MNGSASKHPRPRPSPRSVSEVKRRRGVVSTVTSVAIRQVLTFLFITFSGPTQDQLSGHDVNHGNGWLTDGRSFLVPRLFAWYSLITILLRCPSSSVDLTADSPKICRPYLTARTYVAPRLEPYYDAYAAPYVHATRPYVQSLNQKVVNPAVDFGKHHYHTYGAPHVDRARNYGESKWQQDVRPRIDAVAADAGRRYDSMVAPHVRKAMDATSPYYDTARERMVQSYHSHLLPVYVASLPVAQRAYALGHSFVVDTGFKYVDSAWRTTSALVNRTVWPRIRILYGENVEPQLTRIGERLGRYRDRKKLEAVVSEVDR